MLPHVYTRCEQCNITKNNITHNNQWLGLHWIRHGLPRQSAYDASDMKDKFMMFKYNVDTMLDPKEGNSNCFFFQLYYT